MICNIHYFNIFSSYFSKNGAWVKLCRILFLYLERQFKHLRWISRGCICILTKLNWNQRNLSAFLTGQTVKRCRRQDTPWHHDVITNCTQGSTNTKHSRNKAAPQPLVEAAGSKPLLYSKITTGHVLIFFSFFVYLRLLRHARSPTVPRTLVSPHRSTATVMNYANPLVLFRVPWPVSASSWCLAWKKKKS